MDLWAGISRRGISGYTPPPVPALMKIDVRGEICPYPLKKTMEALERLAPGEELEVLTDNPPSLEMIRITAIQRGYAMRVEDAGPAEWRIILLKNQGAHQ